MKKVLLPQPIHEAGMKLLEEKVEVIVAPDPSKKIVCKLVPDAHGIILRTGSRIDKDVLSKARNLQVISRTGAGVDNVDVDEATKRGVLVCNLPGVNALSVAEHTVAFILALAKKLRFMDESVREGRWANRNRYEAVDLEGKILGVIGTGKIGRRVAKICQKGFHLQVIAYDPFVAKRGEVHDGIQFCGNIEEVFEKADFVSVHVAGTPETKGLVDKNLLDKMKKDAYLINTSRGKVIDEHALIKVLQEGKIAGAALDVFREEPLPEDNPLVRLDNVILSPHSASLTRECVVRLAQGAVKAVLDTFSGKLPEHIYNREELRQKGFITQENFVSS